MWEHPEQPLPRSPPERTGQGLDSEPGSCGEFQLGFWPCKSVISAGSQLPSSPDKPGRCIADPVRDSSLSWLLSPLESLFFAAGREAESGALRRAPGTIPWMRGRRRHIQEPPRRVCRRGVASVPRFPTLPMLPGRGRGWAGDGGAADPVPADPAPADPVPSGNGGMRRDSSRLLGAPRPGYGTLQPDTDPSRMEVTGYQTRTWRVLLCHAGSVLSAGLLLLLFHWKPSLEVQAKCKPCTLGQADWLLIRDRFGRCFTAKVLTEPLGEGSLEQQPGPRPEDRRSSIAVGVADEEESRDTVRLHDKEEKNVLRYYLFQGMRYVWLERRQAFCRVSVLDEGRSCAELHLCRAGLELQEHSTRRRIYGPNLIEVPVKSYARLLVEEVLNPFYIFQVLSMVLWVCDAYYYYAACIFLISTFSLGLSLYETRKQSTTLRNMARMSVGVRVRRPSGEELVLSSAELVPGDCIRLPADGALLLPCDAALLTGECMVNESLLTGESVPVMKTPLPAGGQAAGAAYCPEEHRRHTLFCGTQVIQARAYAGTDVLAVVTRTGFCTAKGDLISSILYPKPVSFKFYKDAVKFVMFLAVLALIGTVYSILILVRNQVPVGQIIIRALDLVTVIVPPALPAAMTVGTIYAQNRLKKQGIFCISPPRINLAGKLRLVCFDKTGTLTEEGLDVWGVVPLEGQRFLPMVREPRCLPAGALLYALAACHAVSPLRGQLVGDPVDLKMLESTGWRLEMTEEEEGELPASQQFGMKVLAVVRPPPEEEQPRDRKHQAPVGILRRFPFSSSFQRMSVLVKLPGEASAHAYVKGAPEMVASLCRKETVPPDFSRMLRLYTTDGFRVLALACKALGTVATFEEALQLPRDSVESGLSFLGFLVMKNVLKPESAPVIHLLRSANIRPVMVTGDNMLTAMNVARGCRMVEPREGVIFVTASPPGHGKPAALKFVLAEHSQGEEQPEGLQQQQRDGSSLPPRHCHFALNGKSFQVVCEHFADLLPRLLRGDVRGWCQRLRGAAGGRRGHLPVRGRGVRGLALHLPRGHHRVRAQGHPGGPVLLGHLLRGLQVHGPVQPGAVRVRAAALHHQHQPERFPVPLLRPGHHHHGGRADGAHGAGAGAGRAAPAGGPDQRPGAGQPRAADGAARRRAGPQLLRHRLAELVRAPEQHGDGAPEPAQLREHRPVLRQRLPVPHPGRGHVQGTPLPRAALHQRALPARARPALRPDDLADPVPAGLPQIPAEAPGHRGFQLQAAPPGHRRPQLLRRLRAGDRPGSRLARLLPKAAPEKSLQEAFQEAGEGAEPAAAGLAAPGPAAVRHAQDVPRREIAVPAVPACPRLRHFLNLLIPEKAGMWQAGGIPRHRGHESHGHGAPMATVLPWPH
ncbi:polyamine-transporting ATPase 13A2 isoform X2 [Corvus hawaiiensis]|uniref:polyamine-transporting ATPase 13A2 isoform X2 n=1 Tax=Corvus hawaiiensis TaxID=134902 RepID=UPI00201900E2|nr:polyamine-transporting ATPase 13A2 isoform X2 [Corvus hawaiiensis]